MKTTVRILVTLFMLFVGTCFLMIHGATAQNTTEPAGVANRFDYAELAKTPAKARGRKNPQEGKPEAALVGRKLFAQHCAECHGPAAEGGKKAPSLRADEVQQATPGALFWILTNGVVRRGMPVWSKLPEPQRWAIVTYIKTLKLSPSTQHPGDTTTQERSSGRTALRGGNSRASRPPFNRRRPVLLLRALPIRSAFRRTSDRRRRTRSGKRLAPAPGSMWHS